MRVLRTVGLVGIGEIGVRGRGDLAREAVVVLKAGTASASFGRAARASILIVLKVMIWEGSWWVLKEVGR